MVQETVRLSHASQLPLPPPAASPPAPLAISDANTRLAACSEVITSEIRTPVNRGGIQMNRGGIQMNRSMIQMSRGGIQMSNGGIQMNRIEIQISRGGILTNRGRFN